MALATGLEALDRTLEITEVTPDGPRDAAEEVTDSRADVAWEKMEETTLETGFASA